MRHEYLDTLFKIKNTEEKMGADKRIIPDINLKIASRLKKENPEDDYVPQYVAKTRNKLKKLRNCQVDGMTGLQHLEHNRDKEPVLGMQERDIDQFINKHYISPKQKKELEKKRLEEEKKRLEAEAQARKKLESEQKLKLEAEQKKQEAEKQRLEIVRKKKEAEDAARKKEEEDRKREDDLRRQFLEEQKAELARKKQIPKHQKAVR